MRVLISINNWIERVAMALSVAILGLMVSALTLSVVTRYITNTGYDWLIESPPMLIPWLVFPMLGPLFRRGAHIKVDILPARLGKTGRRRLELACYGITLGAALVFFRAGVEAVELYRRMGQMVELEISFPIWLLYLAFPVGFAGLALFAVEAIWRTIDGDSADKTV